MKPEHAGLLLLTPIDTESNRSSRSWTDDMAEPVEDDILICPRDGVPLSRASPGFRCSSCGAEVPVSDGVLRFLAGNTDEFYEGAYASETRYLPRSERPWHTWPLWIINSGYPWMVRGLVPAGSRVLELGCAGGVRYFGTRFRMIGCDLSLASLQREQQWLRSPHPSGRRRVHPAGQRVRRCHRQFLLLGAHPARSEAPHPRGVH